MRRSRRLLLWSVVLATVACARAAPPFVADAGAVEMHSLSPVPEVVLARDAIAARESQNSAVTVLQVSPDHLRARVGDTIAPLQVLRVSGRAATGKPIPGVVPLYGPFRGGGVVRPLPNGQWLAVRVGRAEVDVRVLRIAHPVSTDSALVRSISVEVFP